MPPLARRAAELGTEQAFDVLAEVQALQRDGRDIVSFAIGEPSFTTPELIKQAAIDALHADRTRYAPSAGYPALRAACAEVGGALRGVPYQLEHAVVCPGAKPLLWYGLLALVETGDEVLYPTPCFPVYENLIPFVGGVPKPILLREERGFRFDVADVQAALGPRSKVLLLNSPGNPCGNCFTPDDLAALAQIASEHDLWVISDEVYNQQVFDAPFASIASQPGMACRTLVVDGHSKAFAMTGWRLGYGLGPGELIEAVARLVNNSVSCTAAFTQDAGLAALQSAREHSAAMCAELQARRDRMVAGLNRLPGVTCLRPGGAFYAFANVTDACRRLGLAGDGALQQALLREAGVAALGRDCFGVRLPYESQQYLRFSYACDAATIDEGLRRMRAFLAR